MKILSIRACNWPFASDSLVLTCHTGSVQSCLRTTDCISLSKSVCCSQFWLMAGSVLWFLSMAEDKERRQTASVSNGSNRKLWLVWSAASARGNLDSSDNLCSLGFSVNYMFISAVSPPSLIS